MQGRTSWLGLFVACCIGLGGGTAAAQPSAPPAGYTIDEKFTEKSPDGTTTIEQYLNKDTDDWKWLFWARRQDAFTQLDPEPAGYPAHFIFTNDVKWIVREQKIGSGTSTLHLYRLTPQGYVRASNKPLGDLAWAYMKSRPDWRKLLKAPEYHDSAYLADGFEDNYRGLGVDWPANRYLVVALSADADVRGRKHMQTGKFDVPAVFSRDNAKALVPE